MTEKFVGISRVRASENDGCGGHSGGGFSGEIRPGIARIDLVSVTVRGHVLWPLPAVMVSVSVSHLIVKKP